MGSERRSKRTDLAAWLGERGSERIGEEEFAELRRRLAPISEGYLRKLLRGSGALLAPLVEGVRQDTLENLERTLLALEGEYSRAAAEGNRDRARSCRRLVIEAKDHARFALRRAPGPLREEAMLWLMTWLENPGAFPLWVGLRKRATQE